MNKNKEKLLTDTDLEMITGGGVTNPSGRPMSGDSTGVCRMGYIIRQREVFAPNGTVLLGQENVQPTWECDTMVKGQPQCPYRNAQYSNCGFVWTSPNGKTR
jgi:hypothetical protein